MLYTAHPLTIVHFPPSFPASGALRRVVQLPPQPDPGQAPARHLHRDGGRPAARGGVIASEVAYRSSVVILFYERSRIANDRFD